MIRKDSAQRQSHQVSSIKTTIWNKGLINLKLEVTQKDVPELPNSNPLLLAALIKLGRSGPEVIDPFIHSAQKITDKDDNLVKCFQVAVLRMWLELIIAPDEELEFFEVGYQRACQLKIAGKGSLTAIEFEQVIVAMIEKLLEGQRKLLQENQRKEDLKVEDEKEIASYNSKISQIREFISSEDLSLIQDNQGVESSKTMDDSLIRSPNPLAEPSLIILNDTSLIQINAGGAGQTQQIPSQQVQIEESNFIITQ